MAVNELIVAMSLIASASQTPANPASAGAPPGTPETRYCLRVDPLVGSRVETIQCKTRDEWAALEIDVDQEWSENGVRTISYTVRPLLEVWRRATRHTPETRLPPLARWRPAGGDFSLAKSFGTSPPRSPSR